MMSRIALAIFVFAASVCAEPSVEIELVPDNPGPYVGGESITVDVWARNQLEGDNYFVYVRLDFSIGGEAMILDPTFTFDLSAALRPDDFQRESNLPLPWVFNSFEYECDVCFLHLPAEGGFSRRDDSASSTVASRNF